MSTCRAIVFISVVFGLALAGCQGGPAGGETSSQSPATIVQRSTMSDPAARRLDERFELHFGALEGLDLEELRRLHDRAWLDGPDFDVREAAYYSEVVTGFELSPSARETLLSIGFVVVPAPAPDPIDDWGTGRPLPTGAGPADIYYRIFAKDLPVFVSADSILHAWHRSFDELLEKNERSALYPALEDLLERTLAQLDETRPAERDALLYLSVARALLDRRWSAPLSVAGDVERFVDLVDARQMAETSFLGVDTLLDFSQFAPRGHYTNSERLERYFQAMMWLGRVDLVLYDPHPRAPERPREEAAARALAAAMQRSGARPLFALLDRFYGAFVGQANAITPAALLDLCDAAGLVDCRGDATVLQEAYAEQPPPAYSGRVLSYDPPPVALRFFPQRFAYDAWVTARATMPRMEPSVAGGRSMAMVEDVAFALGNDRALAYYDEEMARPHRQHLPATLEAARRTLQDVPPSAIDDVE